MPVRIIGFLVLLGYGLIAKGAVIGKLSPETKTYDKVTILDESGLLIIAHKVPNLCCRYPGTAAINPNICLIIKRARVNFPEGYISTALSWKVTCGLCPQVCARNLGRAGAGEPRHRPSAGTSAQVIRFILSR